MEGPLEPVRTIDNGRRILGLRGHVRDRQRYWRMDRTKGEGSLIKKKATSRRLREAARLRNIAKQRRLGRINEKQAWSMALKRPKPRYVVSCKLVNAMIVDWCRSLNFATMLADQRGRTMPQLILTM